MKILGFLKKEVVFSVATACAIISAFFIPPTWEYLNYIDFRTLGLLFSLMLVVAGLKESGLFLRLTSALAKKAGNTRILCLTMILLCFFFSMLITNDVCLVSFVPFAVMTLQLTGNIPLIMPTVILQTIAANLGSMLTPMGNPQNLYLYSISGMKTTEFLAVMVIPWFVSLVLLILCMFWIPKKEIEILHREKAKLETSQIIIWGSAFILCLLSVVHIVPFYAAALCFLLALLTRPKLLGKVDFMILITFVSFFIFTGNIQRIPLINQALSKIITGHEFLVSILSSQIISNVPAAILLSGFTQNIRVLLLGTNIGGLGTLIASMASLISFKQYTKIENANRKHYILLFTILNLGFLAILCIVNFLFL